MIKLINNITQIIILLGCCAISIFILFVLITFIKNVDDLVAITKQKDLKQKSNYLKKLQILREMPYKLLHHVIKYNVLFDYINSVEFFVGLYGDKPIEIMKNDLNILERNNKIFKFKPY